LDAALAAVIPVMDIARGLAGWYLAIKTFPGVFTRIAGILSRIFGWVKGIGVAGATIGGIFGRVSGFFGRMFQFVSGLFPWVGRIFGMFGKFLGPLGLVITAVQFVVNLFKRLHGIGDAFKKGILNGILFGLKAVGMALYDTLLKPFVSAWNWIKGIFVGKSPSVLGMGIVDGIKSVAAMVFDALSYPWRHFLAWVLDKIPFMGKYAKMVRGGAGGLIGKSVENETKVASVAPETINPAPAAVPGTAAAPAAQAPVESAAIAQATENGKTLQDILEAVNTLNRNLEAGKIGLYVDGQLLSATIARQTEFRGGYGVNKIQ